MGPRSVGYWRSLPVLLCAHLVGEAEAGGMEMGCGNGSTDPSLEETDQERLLPHGVFIQLQLSGNDLPWELWEL